MIKKEYDTIDDMVQNETNPSGDYKSAKEAFHLLLDSLNLTSKQKILIHGGYAYLEELLEKKLSTTDSDESKFIRFGQYVFRYDDAIYADEHRKITGKDIIKWIERNDLENVALYLSTEGIYANMIDVDDSDHYREIQINWDTGHGKYETIDNRLEPEN